MNRPSKRIIKSLLKNYVFTGVVLFPALMNLWEYRTRGYIASPHGGPRIYGEEARAICARDEDVDLRKLYPPDMFKIPSLLNC
jgi:hypothetical protein